MGGGDIADVWRCTPYVAKTGGPGGSAFVAEADGLRRLATEGWPVPPVHYADAGGLVLEYVEPAPPNWRRSGERLAQLHQQRVDSSYGGAASTTLFLGTLELPTPTGTLADVMAEGRILPLVHACGTTLGPLRRRLEAWLMSFEWPAEGAVWVHGDLWAGNLLHSAEGPVLIDPCAQVSERSMDIAMMRLFGGFPTAFWEAYKSTAPIPVEVEEALPAWRLVFLLAHIAMFGRSYLPATADALAAVGG